MNLVDRNKQYYDQLQVNDTVIVTDGGYSNTERIDSFTGKIVEVAKCPESCEECHSDRILIRICTDYLAHCLVYTCNWKLINLDHVPLKARKKAIQYESD